MRKTRKLGDLMKLAEQDYAYREFLKSEGLPLIFKSQLTLREEAQTNKRKRRTKEEMAEWRKKEHKPKPMPRYVRENIIRAAERVTLPWEDRHEA